MKRQFFNYGTSSSNSSEEKIANHRKLTPAQVRRILSLGYKRSRESVINDRDYDIDNLKYDAVHSNRNQIVWRDEWDFERPVISFPGTNVCHADDIIADIYLAVGLETLHPRFTEAKKHVEELRKETGMEPTLVSHSLGAAINEYVGRFYPRVKQINVNKGAGFNTFNRPRGPFQTDIAVVGDCISCLSCTNNCLPTGHTYTIYPTWRNLFRCFGAHRFDNLEQLSEQL